MLVIRNQHKGLTKVNMDALLMNAWNRKVVKEYCDLLYRPNMFDALNEKSHVTQKKPSWVKKAEQAYCAIINDPVRMAKIISGYIDCLNESRS